MESLLLAKIAQMGNTKIKRGRANASNAPQGSPRNTLVCLIASLARPGFIKPLKVIHDAIIARTGNTVMGRPLGVQIACWASTKMNRGRKLVKNARRGVPKDLPV